MTEEDIQMSFTKEGIEVKKKVEIFGEMEWHTRDLDYEDLSGKNIANIESVDPVIEDGELKSLIFKGKNIEIKETKDHAEDYSDEAKDQIEGRVEKGIIIEGEMYRCKFARELLINSANWLIKKGKLTRGDLPVDYGGSKRWLINDKNEHKDKDDFFYPKRLDNGWYIETNYSKETCKRHTKWLLSEFGLEENEFEIKGF